MVECVTEISGIISLGAMMNPQILSENSAGKRVLLIGAKLRSSSRLMERSTYIIRAHSLCTNDPIRPRTVRITNVNRRIGFLYGMRGIGGGEPQFRMPG